MEDNNINNVSDNNSDNSGKNVNDNGNDDSNDNNSLLKVGVNVPRKLLLRTMECRPKDVLDGIGKVMEEQFLSDFHDFLRLYEIKSDDSEQTRNDKIGKFEKEILSLLEGCPDDMKYEMLCEGTEKNIWEMCCPDEKDQVWYPLLSRFGIREKMNENFSFIAHMQLFQKAIFSYIWDAFLNDDGKYTDDLKKTEEKIEEWLNCELVSTLEYPYRPPSHIKKSIIADALEAIVEKINDYDETVPQDVFKLLDRLVDHDKNALNYKYPNSSKGHINVGDDLLSALIKSTSDDLYHLGYEFPPMSENMLPLAVWIAGQMGKAARLDSKEPDFKEALLRLSRLRDDVKDECKKDRSKLPFLDLLDEFKIFLKNGAKEMPKKLSKQLPPGQKAAEEDIKDPSLQR